MNETPEEYAQRRANETGAAYIVTGMGHAWYDCAQNRELAPECGGIVKRFRPLKP